MYSTELLSLLTDLRGAIDPRSGTPTPPDSCLHEARIQNGLDEMIGLIGRQSEPSPELTDKEIADCHADLVELGYQPTAMQMAKVLIGSRSIVDPRLRGLSVFRRYRGILTRRALRARIQEWETAERPVVEPTKARPSAPWASVSFFKDTTFDKLSDAKATELYREVQALGLRKQTERLPAYMAKARTHLPRAFEPWTREERALLIEAMCYTNKDEKLASIFGRSAKSIRNQGKQLIWNSQQRDKVA